MLMTFFNFLLTIFFNKFRTRIRIRQFSLDPDGSGSATLLKRMKKLYITTFLAAFCRGDLYGGIRIYRSQLPPPPSVSNQCYKVTQTLSYSVLAIRETRDCLL